MTVYSDLNKYPQTFLLSCVGSKARRPEDACHISYFNQSSLPYVTLVCKYSCLIYIIILWNSRFSFLFLPKTHHQNSKLFTSQYILGNMFSKSHPFLNLTSTIKGKVWATHVQRKVINFDETHLSLISTVTE